MGSRLPNILLGVWLMAAPAVLGYSGAASTADHIVGPLIASFATIAIWEATRSVRKWNRPLGAWLLVAPWLLGYDTSATINSLVIGALVIAFTFLGGEVEQRFGGGWSSLWPPRKATTPEQRRIYAESGEETRS